MTEAALWDISLERDGFRLIACDAVRAGIKINMVVPGPRARTKPDGTELISDSHLKSYQIDGRLLRTGPRTFPRLASSGRT